MSSSHAADALIIGGGPAGAAAAHRLATLGLHAVVVERRTFPRSKACGDILTPRAVQQLVDMGLESEFERWHRVDDIRVVGTARHELAASAASAVTTAWPRQESDVRHGIVARRRELDAAVALHAQRAGATILFGHDATEPVVERGFVRGALARAPGGGTVEIRAPFLIVADGANSTFGRALGTFRSRGWPYLAAIRSYWRSPRHDDRTLELRVDVTSRDGDALPGYGWIAPMGDGTINVGVALFSTARDFRSTNVAHLLDALALRIADDWGIDPTTPNGVVRVGRVPVGGSVQPSAGPTFLVVGDAAGAASPFSGAGIDTAYETGRLAADVVHRASTDAGATALQEFPRLLAERYGRENRASRAWAAAIGRPPVMRRIGATISSPGLSSVSLRLLLHRGG